MKNAFSGTLLWCLNGDGIKFIVSKQNGSISIFSAEMEFLKNVKIPSESPLYYFILSSSQLLVFDLSNRVFLVNINKEVVEMIEPPKGTSADKLLAQSAVLKSEKGYLFLPQDTSVRKTSFLFLEREKRFKRVNIKLPEYCFSISGKKEGAFFFVDEGTGDFKACSFEMAYKQKEFVPEFVIEKKVIAETTGFRDPFEFATFVAYLSVKNKTLILARGDEMVKKASNDYKLGIEHYWPNIVMESSMFPESGKLYLLKEGGCEKMSKLDYRPYCKSFRPLSDSAFLLSGGNGSNLYSTNDLTLLGSFPIDLSPKHFLPNGTMVYDDYVSNVYVAESPSFATILQ
ncbi:MAG: hypothetical protein K6G74_04265 [Bacilli bacterium]|nr:hypothetical protein [Bacilli bacterium]